ncbi:MAG TPA: aminotransferase class I/II-fold pyridoxal phosphate-dependent enzyme [Sedimentibacter sp.]|nr:aminotransferase class I/II-fold pyridoxal phosphate-dependent enzyme [Sedimentibacter sp.]
MDYKKYISSNVLSMNLSTIRIFFDLVNQMEEVTSLCIGEPDFTTPKHISEVCTKALEQGKTFYTANAGLLELRQEIANYLNRKFMLNYNPESEIIVTVGATEAIDIATRTLINPGDEALIPDPSFLAYSQSTLLAWGNSVFVPTYAEDNFVLKPEVLERFITKKTKLLFLPSPNNPTGSVMTRKQLEDIAEVVKKYDLIVVSDEIYCELTYGVQHNSFASIPGMWDRTITINGLSKSYAMTGWRLGYIAAPEYLTEQILKVHQNSVTSAATMGQYAAIEALKKGNKDIEKMKEEYNRRRIFLLEKVREAGLECVEPKGAFYVFPSIKNTGLTSEEFAKRLLYEAKVAVVPGNAFGEMGEGFIRIAYATSIENIEKALKKIKEFIINL